MNRVECRYADMNGYCDSTACHNMNVVGNIIPNERPENINIGNSSILFKPQGNWHTGTPTENGYYLCHIQFNSEDYESDEEGYDIPYWFKNGSWEGDDGNARIIAWQKIEPYSEASNG